MNDDTDKIIPITEWPVESCDLTVPTTKCNDGPTINLTNRKRKNEQMVVHNATSQCQTQSMVHIRVARWWRRNKHFVNQQTMPASTNPNTILLWVSRTKECCKFLQGEAKALSTELLRSECVPAQVYAALAGVEDWLGRRELGLSHITQAVKMDPHNAEYLWLKEKLSREQQLSRLQEDKLKVLDTATLAFPEPSQVDRVSVKDLPVEEFIFKYVNRGKPVIFLDLVETMTIPKWSLDFVKQIAGKKKVTLKKLVPMSAEWARLEDSSSSTVEEFIDGVNGGCTSDYLFDWSLPLHCPDLAATVTIPEYFAGNYLHRTAPGSLYRDSWPSLFIAPSGAVSQLHVDAFASSFWMALFEGEKRWTFFSPEDLPLLYPTFPHSMDPVFQVNLQHPDLKSYPLLSLTHPSQCVLKAGELLYVPSGSPHFVENLVTSLAVSSNHVDGSNFEKVCQELHVNGLMDPRASDLLTQLRTDRFTQRAREEDKES